jgi:hypothetical protein
MISAALYREETPEADVDPTTAGGVRAAGAGA